MKLFFTFAMFAACILSFKFDLPPVAIGGVFVATAISIFIMYVLMADRSHPVPTENDLKNDHVFCLGTLARIAETSTDEAVRSLATKCLEKSPMIKLLQDTH